MSKASEFAKQCEQRDAELEAAREARDTLVAPKIEVNGRMLRAATVTKEGHALLTFSSGAGHVIHLDEFIALCRWGIETFGPTSEEENR